MLSLPLKTLVPPGFICTPVYSVKKFALPFLRIFLLETTRLFYVRQYPLSISDFTDCINAVNQKLSVPPALRDAACTGYHQTGPGASARQGLPFVTATGPRDEKQRQGLGSQIISEAFFHSILINVRLVRAALEFTMATERLIEKWASSVSKASLPQTLGRYVGQKW